MIYSKSFISLSIVLFFLLSLYPIKAEAGESRFADFQSDATGFQSDATGFQSDATAFQSDATAFQSDATSFNSDAIGFNGDATGFQRDATSFNGDAIGFNSDAIGFNSDARAPVAGPVKEVSRGSLLSKRTMRAVRVQESPKIDGVLDEEVWELAENATDFIQYSPKNGVISRYKTVVKILYDNDALYIGAIMYDPSPDSIYTELGPRDSDQRLNADMFTLDLSPYNDGINGAQFRVSSSNVQTDKPPRAEGGGMRSNSDTWDAVWDSETMITEEGWVAEIKIPYSAIRFSSDNNQVWGINFWREVRRDREQSTWNYVDRQTGTSFNHLGELTGISDIEPPLRLSLTPYVSGYIEQYNGDKPWTSYNGGLDLKFGISESFTLDATLVPDFGQVRSDDVVLNLSPYEVRYNENRPFFMEGTELFSKGGVFYSRRIGSRPPGFYNLYSSLEENEEVESNPGESSLINATKLSGRTVGGLGIGVFNAMTSSMHGVVKDTISGQTREVKTAPFTNYNMIVLDQSLKNNSYISLINTNVWRGSSDDESLYTANVSATDFMFQNQARLYSVSGQAAVSQKYYKSEETDLGHTIELRGGKTGGQLRTEYGYSMSSSGYDPNDMGYLRRNNEQNHQLSISYNNYQPFWRILTHRMSVEYGYSMLHKPSVFTRSDIEFMSSTTFRNYITFMVRAEYNPKGEDDYYEPRLSGWFYHKPEQFNIMTWVSTNRNKRVSADIRVSYTGISSDQDQHEFMISAGPNITFSDRFSANYDFRFNKKVNEFGYVSYSIDPEVIFFGRRDNTTIENTLSSSFIFTARSYLSFRMRHYWSRADYNDDYYTLNRDGNLEGSDYEGEHDHNYNAFNIDMVYTWRFAPGSELSVVWKHSIYADSDLIYHNLGENLDHMFSSDKMNSISLKVLYYLDYQSLKKRF